LGKNRAKIINQTQLRGLMVRFLLQKAFLGKGSEMAPLNISSNGQEKNILDPLLIEDYQKKTKEKWMVEKRFPMLGNISKSKCQNTAIKSKRPEKTGGKSLTSWLNGQVFSVETILGKRLQNGSIEYLVKWKGWSNNFNSWESKESIQNGFKPKERKYEAEITVHRTVIEGTSGENAAVGIHVDDLDPVENELVEIGTTRSDISELDSDVKTKPNSSRNEPEINRTKFTQNDSDNERQICDYCRDSFFDNGNKQRHIKLVHMELRLFKCDFCVSQTSYATKAQLTHHVKRVHGETDK